MRLLDVVRSECIAARVSLTDKGAVLAEAARLAKRSPALDNLSEDVIREALAAREALGSTGFGEGIAIPHCRLPEAREFLVGLITVDGGVEFDALDGRPVRVVVFIVAPETESNEHIRLLSAISQVLGQPEAVEAFLAEETAEGVLESFARHVRDEPDRTDHAGRHRMTVIVQDEDCFSRILQVFQGMTSSSVAVVEAQNAGAYLAKMPLFSGFWHDPPQSFCRVILATVDKALTNDTIRQIERVTGSLDGRDGVLVTVQDVFYAAGTLRP